MIAHGRNESVCSAAAAGGHLEVLKWARTNGCGWNHRVCTEAARHGHLEVLKWARSHGCPLDADTCSSAAAGGRLEVLQWARTLMVVPVVVVQASGMGAVRRQEISPLP